MKRSAIVFAALLFGVIGYLFVGPVEPASADEWFDIYGEISWKNEKLHLDNFAIYLNRNPDMQGYIAFYAGKKARLLDVKKRVARAKEYLIHNLKVDRRRISVVYAGRRKETRFALQPVEKSLPPPVF